MPKICRWDGIVIEMFSPDHPPPHFHALYAEFEAQIAIFSLDVIKGELPRRIMAEVSAWARERQALLAENWKLCRANLPPKKIDPPD